MLILLSVNHWALGSTIPHKTFWDLLTNVRFPSRVAERLKTDLGNEEILGKSQN